MTALITDRALEERLIAERQATGADLWDEVTFVVLGEMYQELLDGLP